jgi:transforming growth factor-beta-induced protein
MPVITEEYKARTIGPKRVAFDCDDRGYTVEGRKIMSDYTLGYNGIVYMLDDVLLPDRARTLLELAEAQHLTTFMQLITVAGLEDTFSAFGDYTIFAPSEAAFYSMDSEILNEAKQNPGFARKLLLYHGTQGRILSRNIKNNQVVMSLDEENPLRLLVYRKSYGVEDGILEKTDVEGMNGVLHIVNKVLIPERESAGDILRKSGNYSMFLQTMESVLASDPEAIDWRKRVQSSNHYTFFVPTDQAFRNLDAYTRHRMQSDQAYMSKVVKNHVSSSMMSSSSFRPDLTYTLPTRQKAVGVSCDKYKRMKVNEASVLKQDIVSTNGIIHVIDKLLLPEND